jgi:hypothetical protein
MAAFFITIFLLNTIPVSILSFLIPIIYAVAFFDGLKKLRLLNDGISAEDGIDDMIDMFRRHKGIFAFLLILAGLQVVFGYLPSWIYGGIRNLIPLLLLAAGIIFLLRRKKSQE